MCECAWLHFEVVYAFITVYMSMREREIERERQQTEEMEKENYVTTWM